MSWLTPQHINWIYSIATMNHTQCSWGIETYNLIVADLFVWFSLCPTGHTWEYRRPYIPHCMTAVGIDIERSPLSHTPTMRLVVDI